VKLTGCDPYRGRTSSFDVTVSRNACAVLNEEPRLNATKTIKYGNPFYENLEFRRGSDISAEALNALNILHDVRTPVRVFGKVGRKYRQYYSDGHAEVFLICRRNKNVANHTKVGATDGCFEFRLGGLPGRYDVLVASSHINWNFIASVKDAKGEWRVVCAPEGGVIYWGIADVNYRSVKTGRIVMRNVPMDRRSSSIREMEKIAGIRLRSNASHTPQGATINTGEQL